MKLQHLIYWRKILNLVKWVNGLIREILSLQGKYNIFIDYCIRKPLGSKINAAALKVIEEKIPSHLDKEDLQKELQEYKKFALS